MEQSEKELLVGVHNSNETSELVINVIAGYADYIAEVKEFLDKYNVLDNPDLIFSDNYRRKQRELEDWKNDMLHDCRFILNIIQMDADSYRAVAIILNELRELTTPELPKELSEYIRTELAPHADKPDVRRRIVDLIWEFYRNRPAEPEVVM